MNRQGDASFASDLEINAINWPDVLRMAGFHLVTPSLAGALKHFSIFDHLDPELQEYLGAVCSLNQIRNNELRAQLTFIARELNSIGIKPLLIKGAIALLPEQYPGSSDRIMGDLDIVVPEDCLVEACDLLRQLGYREEPDAMRWLTEHDKQEMHHLPPMQHHSLPVSVELHRRLLSDKEQDAALREGMELKTFTLPEGTEVLIPDPTARLVHSFLHSQMSHQLGDRKLINIRHLLEFASIAKYHISEIKGDNLGMYVAVGKRPRLAEYWAIAEAWLGAPFPEMLPRSLAERRQVWFIERVMTSARWRNVFAAYSTILNLPPRIIGLGRRVWSMPEYLPYRIRRVWTKNSQ